MRISPASILLFLVPTVLAGTFTDEKVRLGKKSCTCSFTFILEGSRVNLGSSIASCDSKCSGKGTVKLGDQGEDRYTASIKVQKGKVDIEKASVEIVGGATGASGSGPPPAGSGSGSGPPMGPGSGSGPPMEPGSGSGPPMGSGSESGRPPMGSGSGPPMGGSMGCAAGFLKVCPEVDGSCPPASAPVCPMGLRPMTRMSPMAGEPEGCECIPMVLMQLVMGPEEAGRSLERAASGDTFEGEEVEVGKITCTCNFEFVTNGNKVTNSKGDCDKKCKGAAKKVSLEGETGSYTFDMKVNKGKVSISKASVKPTSSGPAPGGSGSGRPPAGGAGSGTPGSGMAGGLGSACVCVFGPSEGGPSGGSGSGMPGGSGSGSGPPMGSGSGSGETPVPTAGPVNTTGSTSPPGPVTVLPPGPAVTVPNPGSAGGTFPVTIRHTWSQEPAGFDRVASVKVPASSAGQKLPLVVDLHGNGGQGNVGRLSYLGEAVVIAAPSGYERSWNINNEASKADDVSFILELIAKVTAEYPAADASDVTIIGTSNGAAMIYRLLIVTGRDRPFQRVLPMVSSLISVQWRDDQFWKSATAVGADNDYTAPATLDFDDKFEYAHFHGTEDGTIAYEGKSPGPGFLGTNVDVIAAQKTDYLFAQAMGFTGAQLADSAGATPAEADCSGFQEYEYLGGRVRHFKDIGGTHGSTFGNACTKAQVTKLILG